MCPAVVNKAGHVYNYDNAAKVKVPAMKKNPLYTVTGLLTIAILLTVGGWVWSLWVRVHDNPLPVSSLPSPPAYMPWEEKTALINGAGTHLYQISYFTPYNCTKGCFG
jgi:hypothetical protein